MTDRRFCKNKELYQLTHPEEWPHEGLLPLNRRGGNVVYNVHDAGIVMDDNVCRVWTSVYLGETNPQEGIPADVRTHLIK
jgi:hypothetical protein